MIERKPALRLTLCLIIALSPLAAFGKARMVNDHNWQDVDRIVAIGDLHGDWDQYMKVMSATGLVDRKGKWAGGETHLVQTGDVPDRGPDTRKILDHLQKLKKEAKRKGGAVHTLIGNHDAMNVYGDLRYVTPGEYEAFKTKNSEKFQQLQWEHHLATLEARDPEGFTELDQDSFRSKWENDYPLGWVEHRQAWAVTGDYGKQVMENPVVLKVNDSLFLHGGLSAKYCASSLAELTGMVHGGLANFDYQNPGIIEDEYGPLWYRGLATEDERKRSEMVAAILQRYEASRIVVGHTPTQGVVWPRFEGRVILNDVGNAGHYGGYTGALEIVGGQTFAIYANGRIEIPSANAEREDYLRSVVGLNPSNGHLQSRLQKMMMAGDPQEPAGETGLPEESSEPMTEEQAKAAAEAAKIEAWLSPDNCR